MNRRESTLRESPPIVKVWRSRGLGRLTVQRQGSQAYHAGCREPRLGWFSVRLL